MELEITIYTSDYSLKERHAVRVDGKYPPELDFETHDQAAAAVATLEWVEAGMP